MQIARGAGLIILAMWTMAVSSGVGSRGAVDIAVTDRTNANASITALGRFVALTWAASSKDNVTDIYASVSRDGGATFGAATRANQVPGEASVSGEQPPRIALVPRSGRDPSVVVVWTAKAASGTRLLSARSDNGGRSFASALPVPGSEASGNRGWESIATDPDGRVVAVWLDHRDLAGGSAGGMATSHEAHQAVAAGARPTDGVARAQLSQLFFGRLGDTGRARALAGGVCYCCKTGVAAGRDGSIYAAWRQVYPANVRDIAFTMSSDRGATFSTPVRVSDDQWVLEGCPENGPALAVGTDRRIHVVWPTLVPGPTPNSEPSLALFYAVSQDGRQFTPRLRIPTEGLPRHAQLVLGARGDVIVVWDEQANGTRRIVLARGTVAANGAVGFARENLGDGARGSYPVIAATPDGPIVAWTGGSTAETAIRVERLGR